MSYQFSITYQEIQGCTITPNLFGSTLYVSLSRNISQIFTTRGENLFYNIGQNSKLDFLECFGVKPMEMLWYSNFVLISCPLKKRVLLFIPALQRNVIILLVHQDSGRLFWPLGNKQLRLTVKHRETINIYNDGWGRVLIKKQKQDNEIFFQPFFCGQSKECQILGSDWALAKAKENIEKWYLVVGILEDFNGTLAILEDKLPRFFRNATTLYNTYLRGIQVRLPSLLKVNFYPFICQRTLQKTQSSAPHWY